MASNGVVGALRVVLGLDSAQYEEGLKNAQKELAKTGAQLKRIGGEMSSIGASMSLSISAPLAAAGIGALKSAKNFETAMIDVRIATKATADEMKAMEEQAREIGSKTVFSAGDAAGAMEMLAKAGVSTKDILGGAAKATVDLASASGAELEPAAAAVSDAMNQFHLSAQVLPLVVNQITGAVNESKLSFEDYQLAMGQAGGSAANLGVSFKDFNAVLAGTSPLFQSGSDAGTSFKTFLSTLTPKSKDAANAMKAYGLSFFEADGSMKSMADIAEMLKVKLGGLSDQAKNTTLREIFGTDAWRTALGLMNLGAEGLDRIRKSIAETDAAAQSAERMKGLTGQLEQMRGALEELGIAIGKSGMLKAVTDVVKAIGEMLSWVAKLPAPVLGVAASLAAVAAVAGPLIFLGGQMIATWGTILTLGGLMAPAWAGVAVALRGFAASSTIAAAAARGLGASMAFMMGPWGLVIMGIAAAAAFLAVKIWGAASASKEMQKTTVAVNTALDEYEQAAMLAAIATGKEKDAALEAVKAKRLLAMETIRTAKSQLAQAEATLRLSEAETMRRIAQDRYNFRGDAPGSLGGANPMTIIREKQAAADAAAARETITKAQAQLARIEAIMSAPINLGSIGSAGDALGDLSDGAGKAKEAVKDFKEELKALDREMMTPTERTGQERLDQLQLLDDALKRGDQTLEQYTARLMKLREAWGREDFADMVLDVGPSPTLSPGLPQLTSYAGKVMTPEEAQNLEKQVYGAFRGGLQALKDGGARGVMEYLADSFSSRLLDNLAKDLSNIFSQLAKQLAASAASNGNGGWGQVISSVVGWFANTPAFANEGAIKVGGSGGIDSQMVALRASPNEHISISKGDPLTGGVGALAVHVTPSRYFDVAVTRVAAPLAAAAGVGAMNYTKSSMANSSRQTRNRLR